MSWPLAEPQPYKGYKGWTEWSRRDAAAMPDWVRPLRTLTINILRRKGLGTKEAVVAAFESGDLSADSTRFLGKKGEAELREAVGLAPRGMCRCPHCGGVF